jgi:tetratricopeptide (TPR) repeat protein
VSDRLPKAERVGGASRKTTWVLVAAIVVLLGVGIYLVAGSTLFSDEPQSDTERDLILLQQAAQKDPENPEVLMTLAEAEYELGRTEDAMKHGASALEFAKDQANFRTRFAALLVQEGMLDEAAKLLEEEIKITEEQDAEPYFLLAQVQVEQGNVDEGIETIEIALKIDPMAADMRVTYAFILEGAGRKDDAIEQYQEALRFLPGNTDAIEGLKRLGVTVEETTETVNPHETESTEGDAQ